MASASGSRRSVCSTSSSNSLILPPGSDHSSHVSRVSPPLTERLPLRFLDVRLVLQIGVPRLGLTDLARPDPDRPPRLLLLGPDRDHVDPADRAVVRSDLGRPASHLPVGLAALHPQHELPDA